MRIGIGLPNHVCGTQPTVIPAWAALAEAWPGGGQTETKYIPWAEATMRLWPQIMASLDDDDVVDLLTEVDVTL